MELTHLPETVLNEAAGLKLQLTPDIQALQNGEVFQGLVAKHSRESPSEPMISDSDQWLKPPNDGRSAVSVLCYSDLWPHSNLPN